MLCMLDSLILYYEGRDKEILHHFVDYCKSLFIDTWFFYCIDDEDGLSKFLMRVQKRIEHAIWKDDVADAIFSQFRQKANDKYQLFLLPRTIRELTQSSAVGEMDAQSTPTLPDTSTEVERITPLADELLDKELPTLLDIEQNPAKEGRNFWKLLEYVRRVFDQRVQVLQEASLFEYVQAHTVAYQLFSRVFAERLKDTVLLSQQAQLRNEYQQWYHRQERQERQPAYRQTGLVSYLTADQRGYYDTPSLYDNDNNNNMLICRYMLKVAKKRVLRELRPEIMEKKESKLFATTSVKVTMSGKAVEVDPKNTTNPSLPSPTTTTTTTTTSTNPPPPPPPPSSSSSTTPSTTTTTTTTTPATDSTEPAKPTESTDSTTTPNNEKESSEPKQDNKKEDENDKTTTVMLDDNDDFFPLNFAL